MEKQVTNMSINKTFKEEIIEKFNDQATTCGHCHPRGLRKMKEGVNEYQSELDENKVLGFIKETLNLYKQKILEALPEEKENRLLIMNYRTGR